MQHAPLLKHLATTRPGNRTHFEQHLFSQEDLWQNLEDFSKADPPVLLWHDHGKYQSLFKLVAPRFLLALTMCSMLIECMRGGSGSVRRRGACTSRI